MRKIRHLFKVCLLCLVFTSFLLWQHFSSTNNHYISVVAWTQTLSSSINNNNNNSSSSSSSNNNNNNIINNNATAVDWTQTLHPSELNYTIDLSNTLTTLANWRTLYINIEGTLCYLPGINEMVSRNQSQCKCIDRFSGQDCGVPNSIWAHAKNRRKYQLRDQPRRVLMGLVVHHELELTEVRFKMLDDLVDIFIIAESNVTAGGDKKDLLFFDAFKSGFLTEFHHKILYVFQGDFPPGYVEDGWLADKYIRTHMSTNALSRISGLGDDDLFLSFDADEIPKKEVITFLKLYDGYAEPFYFQMRWTIFGFFWQKMAEGGRREKTFDVHVGSSIKYLTDYCHSDIILIRHQMWDNCTGLPDKQNPLTDQYQLQVGIVGDYAGHHCSWCFSPEGIRTKLLSAQKNDKPRWGDYPEKLDLEYIYNLTKTGFWFDGTKTVSHVDLDTHPDFAPEYMLQMRNQYSRYLLLLLHPPDVKKEGE